MPKKVITRRSVGPGVLKSRVSLPKSSSTSSVPIPSGPIEPERQHHLLSIQPSSSSQRLELHPYSNSRLTSVNMCPTWGVVSAQKRYPTSARSMALEYGALMHEVFAAIRIWQLHRRQRLHRHAESVALRLFGAAKS